MFKDGKYVEITNLVENNDKKNPFKNPPFNIYTFTLGFINNKREKEKESISIKITFGEDNSVIITNGFRYLNDETLTKITIILLNMIKNLKLETYSLDGLTQVDEKNLSEFLIDTLKLLNDGILDSEDGAIHSKNFELDEIDTYIQSIIDHWNKHIEELREPKK